MKVEKSESGNRERFQKRKLSRGASSSSGKRGRESKPSQCKVLPQGEEDKAVQWYLVLGKACP